MKEAVQPVDNITWRKQTMEINMIDFSEYL